jgi:hypothetical protein
MKNQSPESNTPSKIGRMLETTGKSLPGNNTPYNTRKITVITNPKINSIHEAAGSFSPSMNSLIYS